MFDGIPSPDEEWVAFLHNAIAGLTKAGELLQQNPDPYQRATDWFRDGRTDIPREDSVTVALTEIFNGLRTEQVLHGRGPDNADLRSIYAETQVRRPRDPGLSDKSKPTDYRLTLLKDGEMDLRIEAKTVLDLGDLKSGYLGNSGLLRFEDQSNPYTVAAYGGMLAYVVDHSKEHWRAVIAAGVREGREPNVLRTLNVAESDHQVSSHIFGCQPSGNPEMVDVVHFVIEIEAVPSRREPPHGPSE